MSKVINGHLIGTIDGLTFSKTINGYVVRKKSNLDKKRISTDPAFTRTRENCSEFGAAAKANKLLRNAFYEQLVLAGDKELVKRLQKLMMTVIQKDTIHKRGERTVINGAAEMLKGFEFNSTCRSDYVLPVAYNSDIDMITGACKIDMAPFRPARKLYGHPDLYFKILACSATINFGSETFLNDCSSTELIKVNDTEERQVTLTTKVPPGEKDILFLALGVRFYQVFNGHAYPVRNGKNVLRIIAVQKTWTEEERTKDSQGLINIKTKIEDGITGRNISIERNNRECNIY